MAYQTHHHIIEQCQVSPPPGSVPSTSLPLTFFDLPWVFCHPVQRMFFYDFPYPSLHFFQTILPKLKHSLSLTLQHFFPFASNFVFPPKPHSPYLRYVDGGNSVPFTVAESTADFTHLVTHSPKDVKDLHPFVPSLPSPRTLEDGSRVFSVMAIQVTVLPNSGFSICVTFFHVVGDGRAFHHFMKFWASVCRKTGDLTSDEDSMSLPIHNRDVIKDPRELKLIYLEELWKSLSECKDFTDLNHGASNDKVRATFVLSRNQVEKFKKWVSMKCSSYGSGTFRISSLVVACSLIWVCRVKSEETDVNDVTESDELCKLAFLADCRNRPELSIPSTYFGNCLVDRVVAVKRNELMGENGIVKAAIGIESKVRDFEREAFRGLETWMSDSRELAEGKRIITVAGSPKLGVYDTDFGWGKPKKSEAVHIENSGSICLSDCRDNNGGIEVGLALGRIQMNNFATILEERLRNTVECD